MDIWTIKSLDSKRIEVDIEFEYPVLKWNTHEIKRDCLMSLIFQGGYWTIRAVSELVILI